MCFSGGWRVGRNKNIWSGIEKYLSRLENILPWTCVWLPSLGVGGWWWGHKEISKRRGVQVTESPTCGECRYWCRYCVDILDIYTLTWPGPGQVTGALVCGHWVVVVRVRGIIARHCSCEARQDTRDTRQFWVLWCTFQAVLRATKMSHHYLLLHIYLWRIKSMQNACGRVFKLFDGDYSDPLHIAKHLLCWCALLVWGLWSALVVEWCLYQD